MSAHTPWIIVNEFAEECLAWSNEDGWTAPQYATRFTDDERRAFTAIPEGGKWEQVPANVFSPGWKS